MARWNGSAWASVPLEYHDLNAVWGAAAGDVWAVGSGGDILHFDGASWTTVESGTTAPLAGLWGTGPSDVWAAGGGIMHYDGSAWSTVSSGRPSATAVWASGPSDVWAVGNDSLQHFDGQTWVEFQGHQGMGGTFVGISGYGWSSVWGSGRNDVWIVGGAGGALHWNGTTLAAVSSGTTSQLNAVWGAGTDVWVATANDTILKILR
jgi:hypothetical protein